MYRAVDLLRRRPHNKKVEIYCCKRNEVTVEESITLLQGWLDPVVTVTMEISHYKQDILNPVVHTGTSVNSQDGWILAVQGSVLK
jgi:hypothetical protein